MLYRLPTDLEARLSDRIRNRMRHRSRPRRNPAMASYGRLYWVNGTVCIPPSHYASWYLNRLGHYSPFHREMSRSETAEIGVFDPEADEDIGETGWIRIELFGPATADQFADLVHVLGIVAEDIGTGGNWGIAEHMGVHAYRSKTGEAFYDQPAVSFRENGSDSADITIYVTPSLKRPGGPRISDFEQMRDELLARYAPGKRGFS